jgi:hypothetical protein
MATARQPMLETDQTRCYSAQGHTVDCDGSGQDASYPKQGPTRAADRFAALDNVVRDRLTGAVWRKDANPAEFPLTWDEAHAYVADMRERRLHGFGNWRLPPRDLLFSLISHQNINPALAGGHPFTNLFSSYCWSADSCCRLPDQAWYVHLGGGRIHRGMKHGAYLVWPVSPDPERWPPPAQRYDDRLIGGDAKVTDHRTGLIWSRDADPLGRETTWPEALAAIADINRRGLAGRHDWRLPNIRQLESLVDLDAHSPALPGGHPFVNVQDAYWSSTTSVYEARYAWALYCQDGGVGVGFKQGPGFHVWPVCSA